MKIEGVQQQQSLLLNDVHRQALKGMRTEVREVLVWFLYNFGLNKTYGSIPLTWWTHALGPVVFRFSFQLLIV